MENESSNNFSLEQLRHTAAHIVAQAVLRIYPDAKLGIGPATDDGFYYDIQIPEGIKDEARFLRHLYGEIEEIIQAEMPLTQIFLSYDEANNMLLQRGQIFKTELLHSVEDAEVSFYKTGDEFVDLCRGPHVPDTGKVGAIKVTNIDHVHWLNDESRPMLYRISGLAFQTQKELQEYEKTQEELKKRDHRKTGEKLKIYKKQSDGEVTILERGLALGEMILLNFRDALESKHFNEFQPSQIKDETKFTSSDYHIYYADQDTISLSNNLVYVLKPIEESITEIISQIKVAKKLSTKEINARTYARLKYLDQEYAESDEEQGLYHLRTHTQLIAYLATAEENIRKEIRENLARLINIYKSLLDGEFFIEIGGQDTNLEKLLMEILPDLGLNIRKIKSNEDLAISLYHKDILKQNWELAYIKLNQRISNYLSEELTSKESPLSLHYMEIAMVKNLERLLALLTEKYDGKYPPHIAPYNAIILTETIDQQDYARSLFKQLTSKGLRVKMDLETISLESKIENARELKYPFMLVVGEQEMKNKVFSVKPTTGDDLGLMSVEEFLQKLEELS